MSCAWSWLAYIFYNSFNKFNDYKVNTVLSVKYKSELPFPAVTVCNYNRFRKSQVAGTIFEEWQYALYHPNYLETGPAPVNWTSEAAVEELSRNRTAFEINAAHQKDKLILRCMFGGKNAYPCNADNFTTTLTDFGVCYSFNYNVHISQNVLATQSGSKHGLTMWLNAEQREYTYGINYGAGFKVISTKISNTYSLQAQTHSRNAHTHQLYG